VSDPESYLWDNTLREEKTRLDAQAAIWDAHTKRYLEGLGIAPGWRCLEVGAGSGTMTTWIADRVTPGGSVVAADIDTRFLRWLDHPAVEVRELDITTGDVEGDAFDLVYARMVLMHLPDPESHLRTMARALRPGGWLFVQDVDLAFVETNGARPFTWPAKDHRFGVKTMRALNGLLEMTGASRDTAQHHVHRMKALGLEDVRAESVHRMEWGAEDSPYRLAFERVMPYLVEYAGLSEHDVQRRLTQLSDGECAFSTGPMMSVWGRRPVR
jgi:ubiquinone/menaquinone biosynthesis C-methylase UbiE